MDPLQQSWLMHIAQPVAVSFGHMQYVRCHDCRQARAVWKTQCALLVWLPPKQSTCARRVIAYNDDVAILLAMHPDNRRLGACNHKVEAIECLEHGKRKDQTNDNSFCLLLVWLFVGLARVRLATLPPRCHPKMGPSLLLLNGFCILLGGIIWIFFSSRKTMSVS